MPFDFFGVAAFVADHVFELYGKAFVAEFVGFFAHCV